MLRRGISALSRPLRTKPKSLYLSSSFRSFSAMPESSSLSENSSAISLKFLDNLNLKEGSTENGIYTSTPITPRGSVHRMISPATGQEIGKVQFGNEEDYELVVAEMDKAKAKWAATPAPARGEIVRQIGEELRVHLDDLGMLVALEMGKIAPEGVGEVQEAVDICDFAVGLSRQLNGSVIPSERPNHFMMEQYNPLMGHVGIITAFNFPVAVYFWNLALSLVCGNTNMWKPADTVAFTSIACTKIVQGVLERNGHSPAIASLICGTGPTVGEKLINDRRMELVSFTGSTAVGRHVNQTVAKRFGRALLELGGNNALIVDKEANQDLAVRGVLFGAVGTCGQRCTTTRRLMLHKDIYDEFLPKLLNAYKSVNVGNPLIEGNLCGPLHNQPAVDKYEATIEKIKNIGGKILVGGKRLPQDGENAGFFVEPTVVEVEKDAEVLMEEVFAPILYVVKVDSVDEAITINNSVPQGLSSALFTENIGNMHKWVGALGSDCGIVNVNIGTSGAEIGGAFGGNKETGWGRESGSDAWKQYMRRSTCTINYGKDLPLAQGINFGN